MVVEKFTPAVQSEHCRSLLALLRPRSHVGLWHNYLLAYTQKHFGRQSVPAVRAVHTRLFEEDGAAASCVPGRRVWIGRQLAALIPDENLSAAHGLHTRLPALSVPLPIRTWATVTERCADSVTGCSRRRALILGCIARRAHRSTARGICSRRIIGTGRTRSTLAVTRRVWSGARIAAGRAIKECSAARRIGARCKSSICARGTDTVVAKAWRGALTTRRTVAQWRAVEALPVEE